MAPRAQKPQGPRLFLPLLLGILSFVLATAFTEYAAGVSHANTVGLFTQVFQRGEHLGALRSGILRTLVLVEHLGGEPPESAWLQSALVQERQQLRAEATAIRGMPAQAGEADLLAQLEQQAARLDAALGQLVALPPGELAEPPAPLRAELRYAALASAEAAGALIHFDTRAGQLLVSQSEALRRQASYFALGLDGVCALLCCGAALAAWRTIRFYLEKIEAQTRLLEARASELEAFSARVAHDILSPLGVVSMVLQDAGDEALAGQRATLLARGRAGLGQAVRTVEGLLAFARAGAQPAPGVRTAVAPALDELVLSLAPRAREGLAELRLEGTATGEVACHAGVLSSVLTNLVDNALKYLGEAPVRSVTVRAEDRPGSVYFEVEDSGPGIPPGKEERIFEPYVRLGHRGEPGIGLGLATVKRLCQAHGGAVGVRAAPGGGATFWFELPRASAG